MPAGSAQDALHAQIRDRCDGLKVALLAPFDHCRKQQERRFPQTILCSRRHALGVNAKARALPDTGSLRRRVAIQQHRERIRQHVAPCGGQQANTTNNVALLNAKR